MEMGLALCMTSFVDIFLRFVFRVEETFIRVDYFFREGVIFGQGVRSDVLFTLVMVIL